MSATALVLIDLQNDYFPGGRYPLDGTEAAAARAGELLALARETGAGVVHVRHEMSGADAPFFERGTPGAEIHASLAPQEGEPVVVKEEVNAFLRTDLDSLLRGKGVARLVIVGAMSHMCVDAASRAALDLGYEVILAHDATATRPLSFNGTEVPSQAVQAAMMAALEFAGATVVPAAEAAAALRD
ncbi:cysteine hydrolase family protein [Ancylobacter sp. IITR112]|uniref:cysteine hydrolase family protein n=1 Tax=Ancylobacter sp. IITR112 TaxID=3138073 RepID=UPI00352A9431